LKGVIAIAHPGYEGKTIIANLKPPKTHKNIPGSTKYININKTKRGKPQA
jgi:hypothetical protein